MVGRRLLSWLLDVPTPPDEREPAGPLVLELEPVYDSGAVGALRRVPLEPSPAVVEDLELPAGVVRVRVRLTRRAGIYAGDTLAVDPERMPPVAFRGPR